MIGGKTVPLEGGDTYDSSCLLELLFHRRLLARAAPHALDDGILCRYFFMSLLKLMTKVAVLDLEIRKSSVELTTL